jgi:uroporphyrinogen-III synthase
MKRVLVLRPEPGASATIERACRLGLHAVAVPLFEVEAVGWNAPDPTGFDGLLLTSANAVRYGGEGLERLRGLEAYAVGETTARTARDAGFDVVATGDSGVDALLSSLPHGLKLLHLCGADRHQPERTPPEIRPVIVYRSRQIDALDLSSASDCVALIHSPRAGRRFAQLVGDRASIAIAAISAAAADGCGTGWLSVDVADDPTDEALLALAASLCNKPEPE